MRRLIESGALRGDRFLQIGLRGYWPRPGDAGLDGRAADAVLRDDRDRRARPGHLPGRGVRDRARRLRRRLPLGRHRRLRPGPRARHRHAGAGRPDRARSCSTPSAGSASSCRSSASTSSRSRRPTTTPRSPRRSPTGSCSRRCPASRPAGRAVDYDPRRPLLDDRPERTRSRRMRILLVGAGGVGRPRSRPSPPAATSSSRWWSPTTTWPGPSGPSAHADDRGSSRRRSTRPTADAVAALCREHGDHPRAERRRPALRHADLRRRVRRRRRLPRHGDVAVAAAPRRAVRADRREARRRAVRARPTTWEAAGRLALVGIGVEPGLSDVFARYAADHLFCEIDELGVRDGANLDGRRATTSRRRSRSGPRSRSASTRR